jgi:enterochelin esterase-like enzyme
MKLHSLSLVFWAVGLLPAAEEKPFMSFYNPPPQPIPLLEHRSYESAAMKTKVGYNIYLPPSYGDPGNTNRYPVIYWLHGRGCSESNDQFPAKTVELAIRDKIIPPLIVVYASGGGMSFYSDSANGQWLAETTIIQELVPHVDTIFRTLPGRGGRAIQGMSMGGIGAMKLALKYPDLFSSVVAFAGGYRTADGMHADEPSRQIMERVFANDSQRFLANHPATIARANAETVRGALGIKMLVGLDDYLLENNRSLHATLTELQLPHEYSEIPGTRHDLPRLSAWIGADGLEFAVKHFAMSTAKDNDGPWVNPPTEREKTPGTEHHIFWSEAMRRPIGYNVYLPPDYYGAGAGHGLSTNATRYPVVFYLHGRTDSESTHLYNVALLDRAIRQGELLPMICVWTYAGRTSWFTDYADGSVMAETVIVKELIPRIDARWRTLADREHRAVQGWSMGGSGALRIACRYPQLFSSAVLCSGGFESLERSKKTYAEQFIRQYGDDAHFNASTTWTLVREHPEALKNLAIRQCVGAKDSLLELNRQMHALLAEYGIAHEYEELPDLGHDPRGVWNAVGVKGWAFNARHFSPQ